MNEKCIVYKTAEFIGKKWTLLILLELYKGRSKYKRYSELKNCLINITPKILSARLKELASNGLIAKKINNKQVPIKCYYSLTGSGKDFVGIIKEMKKWALNWKFNNKTCENTNCKLCNF